MSSVPPGKTSRLGKIVLGVALVVSLMFAAWPVLTPVINPILHPEDNLLENPNLPDEDVTAWATKIVTDTMTFDATTADHAFPRTNASFTPSGWREFSDSFRLHRVIKTVKDQHLSLATTVDTTPTITEAMTQKGLYTWHLTTSITMTFIGDGAPKPLRSEVKLTIVRSNSPANTLGIAIADWVFVGPKSDDALLEYPDH